MQVIFNHIRKEKKQEYYEALDKWCSSKEKLSECIERVMKTRDINDPVCKELTLAAKEERKRWKVLNQAEYAYKHEPRFIITI